MHGVNLSTLILLYTVSFAKTKKLNKKTRVAPIKRAILVFYNVYSSAFFVSNIYSILTLFSGVLLTIMFFVGNTKNFSLFLETEILLFSQ